jgi:hypothetical protein
MKYIQILNSRDRWNFVLFCSMTLVIGYNTNDGSDLILTLSPILNDIKESSYQRTRSDELPDFGGHGKAETRIIVRTSLGMFRSRGVRTVNDSIMRQGQKEYPLIKGRRLFLLEWNFASQLKSERKLRSLISSVFL